MNTPVFFVVGPVGHGKTTAREILTQLTHGQKGGSCSDVIYGILAALREVSVESLKQHPKEALRPVLIELGDWLCQVGKFAPVQDGEVPQLSEAVGVKNAALLEQLYRGPSILIRTLYLNGYNIIDGVRRRLELQNAIGHLDWNGVRSLVIHVTDPRKPLVADNSEDLTDLAHECVVNDGTPGELETKLAQVIVKYFGAQDANPPGPVVVDELPDTKSEENPAAV